MSNTDNTLEKSLPKPRKGMSLQEMRLRLAVNSMKIKIEQERLKTAILPGATPYETALMSGIGRLETIMSYATLFITIFRMAKKGVYIVKELKNKS